MDKLYKGIKDMSKFENTLNAKSPVSIVKETEKAVAYEETRETAYGDKTELIWVPKSIIKDSIIPFWFLQKQMGKSFYN